MRFLYIGQYTQGTTSRMRGETLKRILKPSVSQVIDTHVPFYKCYSLFRSLAFRYKTGPVIWNTNSFILQSLSGHYDVIWVDKAVFINPETTRQLRSITDSLIHYTPDTAFKENQSKAFYKSISYYDYAITTKSFERDAYLRLIPEEKLLFIPQGFDKKVHYPRHSFIEKKAEVLFIGLYEPARAKVISYLLHQNIRVTLAGKNWHDFIAKHKNKALTFMGESLFKEDYAWAISGAKFSLGLVSKRFPELHTTRTFEIPACGTALLTERNHEINKFYKEDEVIFYDHLQELANKVNYYLKHDKALKKVTQRGYEKVTQSGYDYESQLTKVCRHTGILKTPKA